jgi:hypothetical protein
MNEGRGYAHWYIALNVAFGIVALLGGMLGHGHEPRIAYLCVLMLLCSSPLLWLRELNGRYTLLCVFGAAYFMFYGAADAAALLTGAGQYGNSHGLLDAAEFAVLLGFALVVLGYHVSLALAPRAAATLETRDWPMPLIVVTGVIFWAFGTLSDWYWQINYSNTRTLGHGEGDGGFMLILVVARMLQPLGTIMVGYALVLTRNRPLMLLAILMVALQAVVGFIGNAKEIAMRAIIIFGVSGFLVRGHVPKAWGAVALAFAILAFPIFQAYRAEVIGLRGISRSAAASDIVRSFKLAWSAKEKVEKRINSNYEVPSFLERSALKPTMTMMLEKTGQGRVEFQQGYTLALYFTGFVPRFLWPDKPDSSVGKLVNSEFQVSEDSDTYISSTHLGELYWNFGWPGIVVGMFALGLLLGFINARCDLSERVSLTRLLILVTTIYATIVRFEGSIALEYIVFTRSIAMIGILHLLCARVPARTAEGRAIAPASTHAAPLIHAPQLLR